MIKKLLVIMSGNAATSLLLLARNLMIARLLTTHDYGIAATFAIAMAVVEMMSSLGLQQLIVQAKNGDDPHFQAALQGFQVLRGFFSGALLFAMSGLIARFLGIPEMAWAYQVMAVMPLLNALVHFDIYRLNRKMQFWPLILSSGVPALISILAVWPLSLWFGDYRVMLYAIITQGIMAVVTSHLVAERPYRLALNRAVMARSLSFGWPLLVNGILLFLAFQGDKLIVGRELGMEQLAIFAMGFTLTLTPTLVMAKSVQSFFLPQLSALAEGDSCRFDALARVVLQAGILNGAALVLGTFVFGGPFVSLVLGAKYQALLPLLMWLAVQQALRVFKSGSAAVSFARGQTENAMIANLFRTASLPLAWYVLTRGGDLKMIIWIAIFAETLGFAASLVLLRWRIGVLLGSLWPVICATFVFLVAAVVPVALPEIIKLIGLPLWAPVLIVVFLFAAVVATMGDLRHYLFQRTTFRFEE